MKELFLIVALLQGVSARESVLAGLEAQLKAVEAELAATQSQRAVSQAWRTVASWKGNGSKNTESFTTKSGEWRVRWKTDKTDGVLSVTVYDAENKLVTVAASTQGAGSDVSYVRAKPGRYYLTINSVLTSWEIAVEEQ